MLLVTSMDEKEGHGMSATRIVGVVLLVVGIVLVIMGVTASRSIADTLSTTFTGRLTENTLWFIIGGAVSAVAGLVLATGLLGRSKS
jgi:uncharacterized membrane protein HdeD (DUF308 family)